MKLPYTTVLALLLLLGCKPTEKVARKHFGNNRYKLQQYQIRYPQFATLLKTIEADAVAKWEQAADIGNEDERNRAWKDAADYLRNHRLVRKIAAYEASIRQLRAAQRELGEMRLPQRVDRAYQKLALRNSDAALEQARYIVMKARNETWQLATYDVNEARAYLAEEIQIVRDVTAHLSPRAETVEEE